MSSLVLKNKLARSLYWLGGHWNFLKLPDLPIDGQASDRSAGHGLQEASHGSPKRQQDVNMEIVAARSNL